MSQAPYDSDLQFSTYADVLVFLLAALLLVRRRFAAFPLLAAVAAANQETSGLVPVTLVVAAALASEWPREVRRKAAVAGVVALACWAAVTWAVRGAYGPRPLTLPYGIRPGGALLAHNLARAKTWTNLFRTVTIVPVLCALGRRAWPVALRALFWTIVPVWVVVHSSPRSSPRPGSSSSPSRSC